MNRTLIITGGDVNYDFALNYLKNERFSNIIAVDGGIESAWKLNLTPSYMIGDFDTVSDSILNQYKGRADIMTIRLNPEKDQTDTQEAMELAVELKSSEIIMFGGIGNRLDHTLSNIYVLELALKNKIPAYIINENNKIYLINRDREIRKAEAYSKYISLLPFTDEVIGVDLRGFKYRLDKYNFSISGSYGIGISNEIIAETASISFEKGILIVIEANDL